MAQWMKSLACSLCILTILMHLVPGGRFAKYVRFYAGLLFFLLAASPILKLLGSDGDLERFMQLEFLKEEYYDMETMTQGMAELKNTQILEVYQRELRRQVTAIAEAYGLTVLDLQMDFGSDGYSPERISLTVNPQESTEEETGGQAQADAVSKTRSEIAGLYQLAAGSIEILTGD